jgi:uncharacterized NAD(P)/FAD-binding protein YdhS
MQHSKPRIVVVGGGAAGTAVAIRLAETRRDVEVVLVDPSRSAGRGVAYSTAKAAHLLNTPAARMSAFPDEPDDFVRWTSRTLGREVAPGEFLPRHHFGSYLGWALANFPAVRRIRARAVEISAREVRLSCGEALPYDAAVLALGVFPPDCGWAPAALRSSPRFVGDPWAPTALSGVPDAGDVLLVGTGLTMVDLAVVLDRPGRVVHAVSRHGLLPREHAAVTPVAAPDLSGCHDLDSLRSLVVRRVREERDWRAVVDSLRPSIPSLWQRLPESDRARFLTEDLRGWEVRRHRMPPAVAARVRALRARGKLVVHAGSVASVTADLRVTLSSGQELAVGSVVNCTGAQADLSRVDDPFVRSLLATGLARRGPLGLGLATEADGRLPGAAPLWTLGSLRRGNLWESTAFPEIREQASTVADAVLRSLTSTSVRAA